MWIALESNPRADDGTRKGMHACNRAYFLQLPHANAERVSCCRSMNEKSCVHLSPFGQKKIVAFNAFMRVAPAGQTDLAAAIQRLLPASLETVVPSEQNAQFAARAVAAAAAAYLVVSDGC